MPARPNILWITLDSIRHDRTSLGDYHRDTTPALERIARSPEGEAFEQCIAADKWSLSSAASMLTGTYPEYHATGYRSEVLPDEVDTVAELLGDVGYRTVGMSVNHFFSESTGLDRGFDVFRMIDPLNFVRVAGPRLTARFAANIRKHSGGFTFDKRKHRPDFLLNELLKKQLTSLADGPEDEPFYFVAHYHGAHHPYYPPRPYREKFAADLDISSRRAAELAFEHTTDIHAEIARSDTFDSTDWQAIRTMYDGLIAYSDSLIGDLFEHLRTLDLGETVLVVTADHGDLLGEYGLLSHELVLHDALIHVPLVVHGLDGIDGRSNELVQHVDVVRTLVECAGGETAQLQGIDLRKESRARAVSQRGSGGREAIQAIKQHNPDFDGSRFHETKLTSVRTEPFKYQRSSERSELFELPDEEEDVSAEYPEIASELDEFLTQWLSASSSEFGEGAEAAFEDETKEHLADLGYLTE